ncbi:MAG: hypothetical protein BM556_14480 [Bacteriovorax sp. MedPE-SWde]|nr:MAG: hypothetical protein BM556_14480 [Bacteriovorax sp. MedPE-SWde]
MKKSIAILAVTAAPFASAMKMEMPKVYGKINKVIAHTDQEDVHAKKSMDGVTDVQNSESRLGVKGKVKLTKSVTAKYKLELGLNSTNEGDAGSTTDGKYGRTRLRTAKVDVKTNYGKFTYGQTYAILSKMAKIADPLDGTVAGFQGDDQKARIAKATKEIGFAYRSRVDLMAYTTPSIHGLTISVAADRDNDNSNGAAATDSASGPTHYEYLARFQRDLGSVDLDLYVGQSNFSQSDEGDQTYMMYGANLSFGNIDLNLGMSKQEDEEGGASPVMIEVDRMFGAVAYTKDKCKLTLTYQTREDSNVAHVKNDKIDYSQIAVNYTHTFNKHASASLTALKWETDNKITTAKSDDNDATQLALGMQLKF